MKLTKASQTCGVYSLPPLPDQAGCDRRGKVRLSIPNREIKNLFIKKIREWFSDTTANDGKTLEQFCNAFVEKDTEKIEGLFGDYLWNTISIRDTELPKIKKKISTMVSCSVCWATKQAGSSNQTPNQAPATVISSLKFQTTEPAS